MKHTLPWMLMLIPCLLLAACAAGTPTPPPPPPPPVAVMPRPSPSALVPALGVDTPTPFPDPISATTTVATDLAPGWTRYESINYVYDLAYAPDGTLWAATNGGLVHWDPDTETYTRYQVDVFHLAVAPDGTLWLGTGQGLCQFDGRRCAMPSDLTWPDEGGVRALAVSPNGVLWLSYPGGVRRFDGTTWKSYPFASPPTGLAVTARGEVWAATQTGVARYLPNQDTWANYAEEQGLPSAQAQHIAVAPNGEVWASLTWGGMVRFDGEQWLAVEGIPGDRVGDIAFAADGTPWVGTIGSLHYPGGSLSFWDGDSWTDVSSDEAGLISMRAISMGPGGQVAAATNLGLGIYGAGQWRMLRDGPTSDRIGSVAVTPDGAAWFAFGDQSLSTTGSGLSRFDGREWTYFLGDAEVNTLAVAPDGSLWAGVGCSVQRFDGKGWQNMATCEELPTGNVMAIEIVPNGDAWVATSFGLAHYDGKAWDFYDKLPYSIIGTVDGAVWISGWEGRQDSNYIARFDGEDWTTFRSADAFPGPFVAQDVTDDGRLWGTVLDGGLAAFMGPSWSDGGSWSVYTVPDPYVEEFGPATRAPDGTLWLRTDNGLVRFDPPAEGAERGAEEAWTAYAPEGALRGPLTGPLAFGPEGEVWIGATRFEPGGH
jgi:ligand-binding sensor domain-containing protein